MKLAGNPEIHAALLLSYLPLRQCLLDCKQVSYPSCQLHYAASMTYTFKVNPQVLIHLP